MVSDKGESSVCLMDGLMVPDCCCCCWLTAGRAMNSAIWNERKPSREGKERKKKPFSSHDTHIHTRTENEIVGLPYRMTKVSQNADPVMNYPNPQYRARACMCVYRKQGKMREKKKKQKKKGKKKVGGGLVT